MSDRVPRLVGTALVVSMLAAGSVALAQELPPGGTFSDDDGNVHEVYIEALVAAGITTGCGEGLFCPDDSVTRGQMAAFLNRAIELPPSPGDLFIDDDDSVFEDDIERLAEGGVTRGCNPPTNDEFCPDDSVSRGQMAAFLVRALDYTDDGDTDFTDDDDSVFEGDIEKLAAAGVTKGCNPPDNTQFCPDDPVSRAEMATFLSRALGLTPPSPPPPELTTTTTTAPTTTTTAPTTTTTAPTTTTTAPTTTTTAPTTTTTTAPATTASITVYNTGAFFVHYYVSYQLPGLPLQTQYSGVFNINQGVTSTIPSTATNVGVLIQLYTGITGWQTACTRSYPQATNAVIILSGTTFSPSCAG